MMLLRQGYQTEQSPTVSPLPPNPYPVPDLKKKKMPDQYNSEYPQLQAPE